MSNQTQEYTLRAMAENYKGGHSWDHLDSDAVSFAADELSRLRAENAKQAERNAALESLLAKERDGIALAFETIAAQSATLAGAKEKFKHIDDVLVSLHGRKGTHVCASELNDIEEIVSKALAAIDALTNGGG